MANTLLKQLDKGLKKRQNDSKLQELALDPATVKAFQSGLLRSRSDIESLQKKLREVETLTGEQQRELSWLRADLRNLKVGLAILLPVFGVALGILLIKIL